jgi:hypothetical protein
MRLNLIFLFFIFKTFYSTIYLTKIISNLINYKENDEIKIDIMFDDSNSNSDSEIVEFKKNFLNLNKVNIPFEFNNIDNSLLFTNKLNFVCNTTNENKANFLNFICEEENNRGFNSINGNYSFNLDLFNSYIKVPDLYLNQNSTTNLIMPKYFIWLFLNNTQNNQTLNKYNLQIKILFNAPLHHFQNAIMLKNDEKSIIVKCHPSYYINKLALCNLDVEALKFLNKTNEIFDVLYKTQYIDKNYMNIYEKANFQVTVGENLTALLSSNYIKRNLIIILLFLLINI